MLFDWYFDGETPSQLSGGFRLSEPSARVFDALAARVGAAVAGRTTYEHSSHFGGGSPHPTAPLFVLSHRPAPEISERQTLVTRLRLIEAVPAPGVTHLRYEVIR
ncbi:MAG TPA: hypothetical protein VGF91_10620 [Solirubrobacteraceae bacterium]|jgi:hypothetical protein